MPFFSIIIPTYNRASLLSHALASVHQQTFQDWECIIVDDGSQDNTKEIIENWQKEDPRFVYIYQTNAERSAARNNGINNAKGAFVCFLDSDDYFLPTRLEQLHSFIIATNTENAFLYTDISFQKNEIIEQKLVVPYKPISCFDELLSQNLFCQQVCISTTILQFFPFNKELTVGEDTELWMRIMKQHVPVHVAAQNNIVVVEHENRSINWKKSNSLLKQLKMLNLVFDNKHSGLFISEKAKKQALSNCYFGIAKYHIWKNEKNAAAAALLQSIRFDFFSAQTKYKTNILLNLFLNYTKSLELIDTAA